MFILSCVLLNWKSFSFGRHDIEFYLLNRISRKELNGLMGEGQLGESTGTRYCLILQLWLVVTTKNWWSFLPTVCEREKCPHQMLKIKFQLCHAMSNFIICNVTLHWPWPWILLSVLTGEKLKPREQSSCPIQGWSLWQINLLEILLVLICPWYGDEFFLLVFIVHRNYFEDLSKLIGHSKELIAIMDNSVMRKFEACILFCCSVTWLFSALHPWWKIQPTNILMQQYLWTCGACKYP